MAKKISNLFFFLLFSLFCASSGLAQTSLKTVIAAQGDGVFSILRKNGVDPVKYYKEFIALNKEHLNSENGLYIGKTYFLPEIEDSTAIDTERTTLNDSVPVKSIDSISMKSTDSIPVVKKLEYPIFGETYGSVKVEDSILSGATYYLISGHGGPDPGALEKANGKLISEDEYAYDVTLRLARKLITHNAKVFIIIQDPNDGIRDKRLLEIDYDEVNYPAKKISRNQKTRLKQRTEAVNNLYLKNKNSYQRLIVTHVDSRSKGKNIDVFFYHHKNSKKGKKLAENIQNTFKKKYARYQPNRVYSGTVGSRSSLYLIKNTLPAMTYIELGNIKSPKDQKRILDYENREALAKWIAEGLILDFKQSNNKSSRK